MNIWPIGELLPHAGGMIMLDAMIEADEERIMCTRTIRPGGLLNDADGHLPAWCGVELMAQCVAAWAGWQAKREQRPVRLGFLLGTRHYRCDVDAFRAGSELVIEAVRSFHDDNGMAMFLCRIDAAGTHAEAGLTVFSPPDSDAFFASTAQGQTHA
ncbi:hotdog family protein [Rhodanobacter sp. A1T4]|uniref:ApeP family dehydratase n=1 Tax=Rhodanobacter sp. A1T4 TaxID=2723087 RepID=UPI0016228BA7|nr:hotdog family protein [Rhodanobacter sp. A1T4]MBB6247712.1 putative hotdog family 3-hydroxylacyl-ACP dehydratase [Rhodanobacter sp. A1T4]